jgi:hypothetical protein
MFHQTSRIISICLSIGMVVASQSLSAQEALRDRFLTEGPKGWLTLSSTLQQLQGTCISRYSVGNNEAITSETKFKINRELLVYEESRKVPGGEDSARVLGVNSKYRFGLQKESAGTSWLLADSGAPSDRLHIQHPYARAASGGFIRFLDAPFTICFMPISEMIKEDGFKLGEISEVTREGKVLVKVAFTYVPPKISPELVKGKPIRIDKHMTKLRGGWMLLNPDANWAIEETGMDLEGGKKGSSVVDYVKSERGFFLPSRVVDKSVYPSTWDVTFAGLSSREIPESEFTLSAYGLPEPFGVVWPEPTRWWLWLSLAGAAVIALGISWRVFYHRIRKVEPVKQVPTKEI